MEHYDDCSPETLGTVTNLKEQAAETIDDLKQKAQVVKEKAADVGRRTGEKIDAQRELAARALENSAETLKGRADAGARWTTKTAHSTAGKLRATARYLRKNDLRAMLDDVEDVVRQHPGTAIAAAAVAGFLVGKAFKRRY
jgi:ElaB/YqjD/DUF883 family membrane-anchored ribosome-binding protein